MINISRDAQKYFIKILSIQPKGTQIRIFVNNPGTSQAKCGICFYFPKKNRSNDMIIKFNLFSVYLDKFLAPFIIGTHIDVIHNELGHHLSLNAPNIHAKNNENTKKNKNNHTLSLAQRIKNVLEFQINPQLSMHGGEVSLLRITEDLLVVLQFHGGCNGCAMAQYTIKEGIERTLKNLFPELKGVIDVTQHKHGKHSYY